MAKDLTVIMEDAPREARRPGGGDRPGGGQHRGPLRDGRRRQGVHPSSLVEDAAAARKALEEAGIDVADEREAVIVDLHNKPGAMGEIARDLAEADVSIDVAHTIFSGVRLVIVTEDTRRRERRST